MGYVILTVRYVRCRRFHNSTISFFFANDGPHELVCNRLAVCKVKLNASDCREALKSADYQLKDDCAQSISTKVLRVSNNSSINIICPSGKKEVTKRLESEDFGANSGETRMSCKNYETEILDERQKLSIRI